MDPRIAWYEPQQLGIAHYQWTRMYEKMTNLNTSVKKSHFNDFSFTGSKNDVLSINDRNNVIFNRHNAKNNDLQQKRKRDNKASTYGLNHPSQIHVIREDDCLTPWRRESKYEPGILG